VLQIVTRCRNIRNTDHPLPLPTCSVRALPEHHQLLRRMARALMDRPELAASLEALIAGATQGVPQGVTRPDPAADQRFKDVERRHEDLHILLETLQERLARQEKSTMDIVALAENINDRVKTLEQPAEAKAAKPRQARPAAAGKRRSRAQAP
jgi:hypothetical protein